MVYSNYCEVRHLRCGALAGPQVMAQWKAAGARVCCDIDVADIEEDLRPYFASTDILFMNEIGFARLLRRPCARTGRADILQSGGGYAGCDAAEHGSRIYCPGRTIDVPGVPVDVVDVTGAGDTYCSSFVSMMETCGDPCPGRHLCHLCGVAGHHIAGGAQRRRGHAACAGIYAPARRAPGRRDCSGTGAEPITRGMAAPVQNGGNKNETEGCRRKNH